MHTHVTTVKRQYSRNIASLQFISLLPTRLLLLVAKPVSWTLDPDRPRKTGSNTLSCFGKPKGSLTMPKNNGLIPMLTR